MKAKAAFLNASGADFDIREYEVTPPKKGEALIKMIVSGVCGTDLHIYNGKLGMPVYPIIIGHELIGEIVDINGEASLKKGDMVLVNVAVPCGECTLCKAGEYQNCVSLNCIYAEDASKTEHVHGGYAQYTNAPITNLVKLPEGCDPKTAVVFACVGPTIIQAFRPIAHMGTDFIKTAVVQGLGPMGFFSVAYLKAIGAKEIIVISHDADEEKIALARKFGATKYLSAKNTTAEDRLNAVLELSDGYGADIAIEGSGKPDAFTEGINLLRNKGVYLVPGQYSSSGSVPIEPQVITFKALMIFGSAQYTVKDQIDYFDFMMKHREIWKLMDSIRTHECGLDELNTAFNDANARKSIKTVIIDKEGKI